MDFTKATNDQLWNIVRFDDHIPTDLLSRVVVEMLDRNLFDKIIMKAIRQTVKDIHNVWNVYKVDVEDLMQLGRLCIYNSLKRFKRGHCGFMTFAYRDITWRFGKELDRIQAKKRNPSREMSYHAMVDDKDSFEIFLPDPSTNLEKDVINKLYIKDMLERLNKFQREVVSYRMDGYTFKEIRELIGKGSDLSAAYNRALKKMEGIA